MIGYYVATRTRTTADETRPIILQTLHLTYAQLNRRPTPSSVRVALVQVQYYSQSFQACHVDEQSLRKRLHVSEVHFPAQPPAGQELCILSGAFQTSCKQESLCIILRITAIPGPRLVGTAHFQNIAQ